MNTIWELRENFLTDPSSEVAPRLSLVEQLEIKVKEVVLALTENTKPQADSIRIYNELFGRILAGEDIFKVLISVLEEGGYHVVKKGQLSPPRAGAHHKYAAESLTAAVLTTVANASQQTVDDAYVNCQRSLAALQREYQEQKDFFEARSSAIIAKNIEFRLLKGEKEKLIYANKCLILMMTLIALFPVT
jgi:hypothetical protein